MNQIELTNVLLYGLIGLLKIAIGLGAVLVAAGTAPGFREGEPFASVAVAVAGVLTVTGAGLTSWLDANRPRVGSAELAHDVDEERKDGVSREHLTVRRKRAVEAPSPVSLTPEQLAQAVAAVKVELTRDPEGDDPPPAPDQLVSQPPHWLPPETRS